MNESIENFNTLIERIAKGDISALNDIYEQYGGFLFANQKWQNHTISIFKKDKAK